MTVLLFPSREIADAAMHEIGVSAEIAGGAGPTVLWAPLDGALAAGSQIAYVPAPDGRVAISHPWTEAEEDWLAAQLVPWPEVLILDALPADFWPPMQADSPLDTPTGG